MRSRNHFLFLVGKLGQSILFMTTIIFANRVDSAPNPSISSQTIPDQAIRIRVVANSDQEKDQILKKRVRDKIAAGFFSSGEMPDLYAEALAWIASAVPKMQKLVDQELKAAGALYPGKVKFGRLSFPEKTFRGEKYAAGHYETLLITLGEGKGTNWWCVLLPPLCLIAATEQEDPTLALAAKHENNQENQASKGEPQAKFFIVELLEKLLNFISSFFSALI